jgi:uncharacterized protein
MPAQELKDVEYFMKILRQHLPELREKYSVNYLGFLGLIFVVNRLKIVILIF